MESLISFNPNSELTMSSKEIAELTGKQHQHILRDCDKLNDKYLKLNMVQIRTVENPHPTIPGKMIREYHLTKMQTFDLLTGYDLELRIKVNRRWAELESLNALPDFNNPVIAARAWADEVEKRQLVEKKVELQEAKIEEDRPKVEFANALTESSETFLVREAAKIMKSRGIDIGEKRLFDYMRVNGYLTKRVHGNEPTQHAMNLELFVVKYHPIYTKTETYFKSYVKLTGKGLQYFYKKILAENDQC